MIPLIFGTEFASSVLLFQILIWQLLWLPLLWVAPLLLSIGRVRTVTALAWASALIYPILLLVLVPKAAAVGAAVATVCYHLAWLLMACAVFAMSSVICPPERVIVERII